MKRRKTRHVKVGRVTLGGSEPIAVQSMIKSSPEHGERIIAEALALEKAGCDILRIAVKSRQHLEIIERLKRKVAMPVVADIHFDHSLALLAIEMGADKIRINPGNINKEKHLEEILDCCLREEVPVRIGVNSGSVREHHTDPEELAEEMVREASECVAFFEKRSFDKLVVSLKAPDVLTTVLANRKFASSTDIPLHVGLTGTGPPEIGLLKSAMSIGALLAEGIGDTIRVSLTDESVSEIRAAREILQASGRGLFNFDIISCPTCGRAEGEVLDIISSAKSRLDELAEKSPELVKKNPKIAIMGCEVNGPGEAKAADVGVAFGRSKAVLFRKGKVIRTVDREKVLDGLMGLIRSGD